MITKIFYKFSTGSGANVLLNSQFILTIFENIRFNQDKTVHFSGPVLPLKFGGVFQPIRRLNLYPVPAVARKMRLPGSWV